ncbi:cell division control protein 25 [Ceratobasidium sp. AG-Ba]|nr:cell division control protein 25 [Ceratobasidium sp. AG-Ba]QRW08025.1 cell division control protein 25 [Ceratobasidium sp. AG-Ba]
MAAESQEPEPFWVRALYDYESPDENTVSLSRGDIIEVLTRSDSGWWDVLIDENTRGWIPSNFVTIISESEARARLPRPTEQSPDTPETPLPSNGIGVSSNN